MVVSSKSAFTPQPAVTMNIVATSVEQSDVPRRAHAADRPCFDRHPAADYKLGQMPVGFRLPKGGLDGFPDARPALASFSFQRCRAGRTWTVPTIKPHHYHYGIIVQA